MRCSSISLLFTSIFFSCNDHQRSDKAQIEQSSIKMTDQELPVVKFTWDTIITTIQQRDFIRFKKLCFDSITACNNRISAKLFFDKCAPGLIDQQLLTKASDTTNVLVSRSAVISSYYPEAFLSELRSYGETFFKTRLTVSLQDIEPWVVAFDFVETGKGYRLYSCDVYGGPVCCEIEPVLIQR